MLNKQLIPSKKFKETYNVVEKLIDMDWAEKTFRNDFRI